MKRIWLRRVIEEHVQLTESPRATKLLMRPDALPIVRVQPIHFQGTIEATWIPFLKIDAAADAPSAILREAQTSQPVLLA